MSNKTIETFRQEALKEFIESMGYLTVDTVIDRLKELAHMHSSRYANNTTSINKAILDAYINECRLYNKCYIPWHNNKYYTEITVDNLKQLGIEKFYEVATKAIEENSSVKEMNKILAKVFQEQLDSDASGSSDIFTGTLFP